MPTKTPLNPVIHGRVDRDDYTIERVFFESFPGYFVSGSLYRPKAEPAPGTKRPGILCPHGHFPKGRFMDNGSDSEVVRRDLAQGAERFDSAARNPLQARCVQLARMGCTVFHYDMIGYADAMQIAEHRSGRRLDHDGTEPGSYGLYSAAAELRLQSNFGLQTWAGVRATDFITSLPDVDAKRIGVTGASGGGTQTMILSAIDDRITAAFPCVMVSTAMQGGCTCENANYMRIGQGNIDIALASAPRPFGMTAADDWTKELKTKGWPDLKEAWKQLGKPANVEAHFDIHFAHNYNHVSRTHMYAFFNRHFALGHKGIVLERDFVFANEADVTVWTADHPMPKDPDIEKKLLKHWSDDADTLLKQDNASLARGWELIVNRTIPPQPNLKLEVTEKVETDGIVTAKLTMTDLAKNETVDVTVFGPPIENWAFKTVVWLTKEVPAAPTEAMKKLIATGTGIAIPHLYLAKNEKNPWNVVKSKDPTQNEWSWSACFTYGYNDPLLVQRVHDVITTVANIRHAVKEPQQISLTSTADMAPVAAVAAAHLRSDIDIACLPDMPFRFAQLRDVQDQHFIPGAVRYGDVPALLGMIAKEKRLTPASFEETAIVDALLK